VQAKVKVVCKVLGSVKGGVGWPEKSCYWVGLTSAMWGEGGSGEELVWDG